MDGWLTVLETTLYQASTFCGSIMGTTVLPSSGILSPLSSPYIRKASPHCLLLFRQEMLCALLLAFASAGSSIAARMAMMAMTTSSSISVKARIKNLKERFTEVWLANFISIQHLSFTITNHPACYISETL